MLRVTFLVLIGYGGLLYLTYWGLNTARGVHPVAGHGLPARQRPAPRLDLGRANATRSWTGSRRSRRTIPGVKHTQSISGQSMLLSANGSNFGSMFVILDEFEKRRDPELYERGDRHEAPQAVRRARSPRRC